MNIPLFSLDYDESEQKAVQDVLNSKWLTMGNVTKDFEATFSNYININSAIAVSNCTAGLHLAYLSLGIGPENEVICPSLTFVATVNSIIYAGGTPVFADVQSLDDWTISPEDIEKKITDRTKAIVVVHYAGFNCKMEEIIDIAKRHDLKVIEDCAHSSGSTYKGKHLGTLGDVSCFSFFSNKNLAIGEGGMVCTNNPEIAKKIKLLRSHGMTSLTLDRLEGHSFSYDVISPGYNYRIDEIRSALGLVQLSKLEYNNKKRRKIAQYFRNSISEIKGISMPFNNHEGIPNFHIFPILLDKDINRQSYMTYLREKGIQTSIHYPPVHSFSYYQNDLKYSAVRLPITEDIGKREVTLPMYPSLSENEVDYIVHAIKKLFNNNPL